MEIAGKVVLITGASSGIGLATARLFAQKGAKLALAARSAEKLEQLVLELPEAIAIPTDMRVEADIQRMVARTQEHYKRIDVLINNAGVVQGKLILDLAPEDLNQWVVSTKGGIV